MFRNNFCEFKTFLKLKNAPFKIFIIPILFWCENKFQIHLYKKSLFFSNFSIKKFQNLINYTRVFGKKNFLRFPHIFRAASHDEFFSVV